MDNDVNSFDKEIENAQDANSQPVENGTQENDNSTNETIENVVQTVDYEKKFSESSKEALRILEENKELKRQLELKDNPQPMVAHTDNLYPGFEDLDEDAKNNLIAYTDTVTKRALEEINKNPAIANATRKWNEQVWDNALQKAIETYPELANSKDEFKSKYYNVNNVPENIESILKDVAKIHLFDKVKEIGAKEQTDKDKRIDIERTTSGSKDPTVKRSLEDWQRMAQENPMQFRSLSKEFNDDMESGKI
jgi:hypothetical protein